MRLISHLNVLKLGLKRIKNRHHHFFIKRVNRFFKFECIYHISLREWPGSTKIFNLIFFGKSCLIFNFLNKFVKIISLSLSEYRKIFLVKFKILKIIKLKMFIDPGHSRKEIRYSLKEIIIFWSRSRSIFYIGFEF